jgi:hypothetical protein
MHIGFGRFRVTMLSPLERSAASRIPRRAVRPRKEREKDGAPRYFDVGERVGPPPV